MKNYKVDWYLIIALLVGFVLRLPGLFDGLPATFNSTEYFLAKVALSLGASRSIDPGIYIYPTFYTYLLFIIYGLFYIAGWIIGIFENINAFVIQFLIDPSLFYFLPRLINTLINLIGIYILYKILHKTANKRVAQLSAVLMAISFYMIEKSNFAIPDMLMIFFSLLTTLYYYKIFDSPDRKNIFLAGIFSGLAIGAKYNAGFLVIGLLITIIILWRKKQVKFFQGFIWSASGVLGGFALTNPLWFVYPERFYNGFRVISAQMYSAVSAEQGDPFIWEILTLIQNEYLIGVLFFAATTYFFFQSEKKHIPAITVILLTFLLVGSWSKKGIDYLLAAYPAWIILGSFYMDLILERKKHIKNFKSIILILLIFPSVILAIYHNIESIGKDTREQAAEWLIEQNDGQIIVCYDNSHYDLGVFDINRYAEYGEGATKLPMGIRNELQMYRTDPRNINFMPMMIANPSCTLKTDNPYESEVIRFRRRTLRELIQSGTDFLITNSNLYNAYLPLNMRDYPLGIQIGIHEVQDFYQQLFEHFEPVKVFKPGFWTPGPEIRFYKL